MTLVSLNVTGLFMDKFLNKMMAISFKGQNMLVSQNIILLHKNTLCLFATTFWDDKE